MDIIINSLMISLFCVGLRIVSDEDMILSFLRTPYVWLQSNTTTKWGDAAIYILKPIIGCVTCMASVWSVVISYYFLGGVDKYTILVVFIAAYFNTLLFNLFKHLK